MVNMEQKRYKFLDLFQENPDGSLTPRRQIYVNGVTFSPGVNFQKGVAFGGVDFHLYKYWDIAGKEVEGVVVIEGFFQP
jgi:hypothetical protein